MKSHNAVETIKKVSLMLERKEKFAFVTYTRSAIFTLTGELKGEKKPPKNFVKLLSDGMQKKDPNFIKAVQKDLMLSSMDKLANLNIKGVEFYDPAFLELYINNNYDVFKTFTSWYFKNTKAVVVSFQSQNYIGKYFSPDSVFIQVPYNDFYSKIESITEEIKSHKDEYDLCIFDCPMLSAALAVQVWDNTDMSIIDLGRTLTVARALAKNNDRARQ
jgi:uncharacterized ubiquitin-like protein YukD